MMVSVIIPTYNRADLLSEAIESVLGQTHKDTEIIVIDDGSTDNTREKLKPYQGRIKYKYIENGGPALARNMGMRMAKGQYIAFLDSDDLYYPYKIEIQADFLDKHPEVAMVCSEFSAFNDNEFWDEFHLKRYHSVAYMDNEATYEDIYSESMSIADAGLNLKEWEHRKIYVGDIFDRYYNEPILSTNTVMFRRKILESIGFQHEPYWLFEDYEFVLRIAKSNRVAFIDAPTYKLRYHSDQISTTRKKLNGPEILFNKHVNLLKIAKKHGLHDRDYYAQNKTEVDRKLAGLNKTLAITSMSTGKNIKRARAHLGRCAQRNKPEYLLWLLTFTPHIIRSISLKMRSMLGSI